MPYPISRRLAGSIDKTEEEALSHLDRQFRRMGAIDVSRAGNVVEFRVPFINGSFPLTGIDSGRASVGPGLTGGSRVVLDLSFRRNSLIVAAVIVVWIGGGSTILAGGTWGEFTATLPFLPIGFLWLTGPWFWFIPRWLQKTLEIRRVDNAGRTV